LSQRHESRLDVKQSTDIKMLAGLRHHRFIGGDYEHHHIEAMRSGKHVFYKPLMAGHVYKTDSVVSNGQIGETDVDSNAALFFFFESIGVDAGERFDESRLSVIDVAGGPDNDVLHYGCSGVKIQEREFQSQTRSPADESG